MEMRGAKDAIKKTHMFDDFHISSFGAPEGRGSFLEVVVNI